ncbi:cytochrome o ubiquinol oxidase [Caballeronia arationis]|jgi:cytochrome o ubiquinol oxidase operon protein cyoD|uniref:Cytochrome bo(3) ubiquinol oxidase subunit 4 n=1 Tax=Caballeronia arationis TaxID=1777142 RepID=A0A7Z7IBB3_9BURK|nr:cytochrome o ubiquinol oxidase subunit IV [Caballeronia arationis]SAK60978.1 cytochrome o ubiquinol oxidase [Caballeronia arationis]SOE82799.1 cytochrome bo3 quinol oxidase subunit 4 [Caballeronia arationis]
MTHTHSSTADHGHGTLGSYVVGFVLSVLLTAAAFGLVIKGVLPPDTALLVLGALAFVQIVVHLVYFLHMNTSRAQRWNLIAFGYTVLAAAFLIVGTMWVMHNVSMNMMSR